MLSLIHSSISLVHPIRNETQADIKRKLYKVVYHLYETRSLSIFLNEATRYISPKVKAATTVETIAVDLSYR
jgi:hypothetical protein